jgi:plasmid stabilization system protein ParE
MNFGFHKDALQEYEAAGLWYEEQRNQLGLEFIQTIETAITTILATPERFQVVGDGVRIFRVKRFPYYVYYRWDEHRDHVLIVAVMHQRRRPDCWRNRLGK